ncbi:hypothetical protein K7432_017369 [Basidiobolus ranarum]|uniref:SH3 domain-containing protein n=1 Tax=Basidiobolus ranarum TaxID=34480 RepID=A0ABR2VLR8_9FUNG
MLLRALNIKAARSNQTAYNTTTANPYTSSSTATEGLGRSSSYATTGSTRVPSTHTNTNTNTSSYSNPLDSKSGYPSHNQSYEPNQYEAPAPPYYSATSQANPLSSARGRVVPPPPPKVNEETATALYDFNAIEVDDLPLKQGDVVVILKKTESQNDWWKGRCNGREGNFPANYVRLN